MLAAAFRSLVFAYNIASALGQTCTKGTGTDGLYTECTFPVGNTAFTKPIGVSTIGFQLIGGRGGQFSNGEDYGLSASLEGSLDFTTDSGVQVVLSVIVGQQSENAPGTLGGSGYGSGGASGSGTIGGVGGGGSSALLIPASNTVLLVAAGGGGGSFFGVPTAPDITSLDDFDDPLASPNGSMGDDGFFAGGGSGGGRRGGGGVSGGASNPGNPGRSYYNPDYNLLVPTFSAPIPSDLANLNGAAVLRFLTPLVPSGGGGGSGRQRARRLRRRNLCAPNHRICSKQSAVCVDLQTSFEHCGTCNNDCSELGDRAICNNGVCQGL